MYSFDDLTRPMTRQQVQAAIYSALATVGVNTTSWKTGAVVRTMIVCVSAVLAAFSTLQAQIARSGFLELSSGDWLTIVAKFVYGIDREGASFATGTVTLDNGAGGVYPMGIGDLLVTNPTTKKSYRNTEAFTLGALQVGLAVHVSAVESGSASNAPAESITVLTTSLPGVDCSNESAFSARDVETDPQLRTRCNESLGALSPMGPWDAYSFAVKSANRPDASPLGITRVRLARDGYGNVTVYVATDTGAVDPSDVAIAQSEVLQKAEPQGVTAGVVSATAKVIDVVQEVWVYNTLALTAAQIEDAIYQRQRTFLQSQPIGGNIVTGTQGLVYRDAIRAATSSTFPPGFVITAVVTTPAADVECNVDDVPVTGTVSTTIHQLATPEGYAP